VGVAFVVARHNGRFELRESLHTARGPRARTLAGFGVLSDDVLARAAARAQRPFDVATVIDSGRRAGAQVTATAQRTKRPAAAPPKRPREASERRARSADAAETSHAGAGGFLAASARMARSLRHAPGAERNAPGDALIDLLGFADAVRASQPPRPSRPLAFPAIGRLAEDRRHPIGLAHR
jgi:hypothetical protein